MGYNSVADI